MGRVMHIQQSALAHGQIENEGLYLLLDGAALPEIMREIYEVCPHPNLRQLYRGTDFESLIEQSPILLSLDSCSSMYRWYIEEGYLFDASILISSNYGIDVLRDHFQSLIEVRNPDKKLILLRYYAPEVMHSIIMAFQEDRLAMFMGPIHHIYYALKNLCDNYEWYKYRNEYVLQKENCRTIKVNPFWDSHSEEWSALDEAFTKNITTPIIAKDLRYSNYCIGLEGLNDEEVLDKVSSLIQLAKNLGLRSRLDLALFSSWQLTQFPEFHEHPIIAKYIEEKSKESGQVLSQLIMDKHSILSEIYIPAEEAWPEQLEARLQRMAVAQPEIYNKIKE